ncbi:SHOCT domain-containing protein [Faecalispora jeddahensis]|uniref:SHOCT domain-containing protein n=1 Tax=Faecalispora jeddahensis TaxID=1414721 RepID=UPI0028A77A50|nr:SHOCT domain-containing protein [Faecalispora jeddahensis]
MQITKITDKQDLLLNPKKKYLSAEALQREFDYYRAEKLLRKMLEKCLVTEVEFNKIMRLNRETFSPLLAQIMPDIP